MNSRFMACVDRWMLISFTTMRTLKKDGFVDFINSLS